ncbi:MAG: paraquat-inducible protein A [Rhodospirillales bacterium]|nr:paraquat-inducible protein A [Rhodospirillales bacterium]
MDGAPHRDTLTGLLLLGASACLVLGLALPAFTVEQFWVFESSKSIAEGLWTLITGKDLLLGIVVLLFSMVFPIGKLGLAIWIWGSRDPNHGATRRALNWSVKLGKWSMMDVFMVALVVAMLSLSILAEVTAGTGIYFFCAGMIASMIGAHRLERRVEKTLVGSDRIRPNPIKSGFRTQGDDQREHSGKQQDRTRHLDEPI